MDHGIYRGMPIAPAASTTETKNFFQALENIQRVFAIRPGDQVLILSDPLLDHRVIDAVIGLAKARGATVRIYTEPHSRVTAMPEHIKALVEASQFVVSTWFCSIIDPFFIAMRRKGQRWVKITYFRNLDLLHTPEARFPIDVIGAIIQATAKRYPQDGEFDLHFSDVRGSDFKIHFTQEMRTN